MKENEFRTKETDPARPTRRFKAPRFDGLKRLVNGDMFIYFQKNFAFSLFLTFLALVYIWNSHYAEHQSRKAEKLMQEIKELKSEYMTSNAQISQNRKHSEIVAVVDTLGLKPLVEPPYKLIVEDGTK